MFSALRLKRTRATSHMSRWILSEGPPAPPVVTSKMASALQLSRRCTPLWCRLSRRCVYDLQLCSDSNYSPMWEKNMSNWTARKSRNSSCEWRYDFMPPRNAFIARMWPSKQEHFHLSQVSWSVHLVHCCYGVRVVTLCSAVLNDLYTIMPTTLWCHNCSKKREWWEENPPESIQLQFAILNQHAVEKFII